MDKEGISELLEQKVEAEHLCRLMGYYKPKDIGITNLTKADIPTEYGNYHIRNLYFIPPVIPNGRRIFGIATMGKAMCVTLNVIKDDNIEEERKFFYKAIENIKNLITE